MKRNFYRSQISFLSAFLRVGARIQKPLPLPFSYPPLTPLSGDFRSLLSSFANLFCCDNKISLFSFSVPRSFEVLGDVAFIIPALANVLVLGYSKGCIDFTPPTSFGRWRLLLVVESFFDFDGRLKLKANKAKERGSEFLSSYERKAHSQLSSLMIFVLVFVENPSKK